MSSSGGLYQTDFYAWPQEQAALLRDRQMQALDCENLAEAIESVGKSQHRTVVFVCSRS